MVAVGDKITAADRNLRLAGASGSVSITPTTANVAASATITFAAGTFTTAPIVMTGLSVSNPGVQLTVTSSGSSTTGATIWLLSPNTSARTVTWVAVGT